MNIGLLPVSFFAELKSGAMSLAECARLAAAAGARGLDLSPAILADLDAATLKRVRTDVEAAGLEIGMLVAYPDFTHPDASARRRESGRVRELIGAAAELGAQFVRLTAGQAHPETGREEGTDWAVEGLLGALEAGREHGVQLVLENHSKPSVWTYPDFAWPADIFLDVARRTEGTELGILFDTANPVARGDDPLNLLNAVADRVRYVHASDTLAGGVFEPVLLGTGAVPFDAIFARLKNQGYNGWISVEEVSRSGPDAVGRTVRFVKETWASACKTSR